MDTIPRTPMISSAYNNYINSTIKPQNSSYLFSERDENMEKKLKNLQLECQRLTEIVNLFNNGVQIEELLKTIKNLKSENSKLEKKASYIYLHYNSLKNEKQKHFSLNEKEVADLKSEKLQLEIENNELKNSLTESLDLVAREKSNTEYLKSQLNHLEINYNSKLVEYEKKMEEMFLLNTNNEAKNERLIMLTNRISSFEESERDNRKLIEELQASCAKFLNERKVIINQVNEERTSMLAEVNLFKVSIYLFFFYNFFQYKIYYFIIFFYYRIVLIMI